MIKRYIHKTLSILHINIRSIYKKFENFLASLSAYNIDPDVIVFSETGIIKNTSSFNIARYSLFYNESTINKCDGTCIYVKCDVICDSKIISINSNKFIRVTLAKNNTSVGVVGHYRSPYRIPVHILMF